jgi:hypothetical protein
MLMIPVIFAFYSHSVRQSHIMDFIDKFSMLILLHLSLFIQNSTVS